MAKTRRPAPPQPPAAAGILARLQVAATSGGRTGLPTNLVGLQTALTRVGRSTASAAAEQEKLARAFALPGVRAQTGAILAQADAARNLAAATRDRLALEARSAAVSSGRYGKDLRAQQLLAREKQRVGDAERGSQAEALADPAYRRAAVELLGADTRARRERAAAQEQLSLDARRAAVKSGQYVKDLGQQRQLARERQKVEEVERRAALQAKYGRAGGALAFGAGQFLAHPLTRFGLGAATATAGAATGMALSGFRGTVEWNRLQLELQMVSRELAGAFKPAVEFVTRALLKLRHFLERLGTGGQDAIMYGGLALGGVAGLGLARSGIGLVAGGAAMLGLTAPPAAAAAGGGLGVAAAAGGTAAGTAAAARPGLARRVGVPAAAAAAASELDIRGETLAAFGAFGAGKGLLGAIGPMGGTSAGGLAKGLVRGAGKAVLPLAAAMLAYDAATGGYWDAARSKGMGKSGAAWESLKGGFLDLVTLGGHGERFRAERDAAAKAAGPDESRRKVTLADAGFDAPGTAFERITNRLALVDAEETDKEKGLISGMLGEILSLVKTHVGKLPPPAMPP